MKHSKFVSPPMLAGVLMVLNVSVAALPGAAQTPDPAEQLFFTGLDGGNPTTPFLPTNWVDGNGNLPPGMGMGVPAGAPINFDLFVDGNSQVAGGSGPNSSLMILGAGRTLTVSGQSTFQIKRDASPFSLGVSSQNDGSNETVVIRDDAFVDVDVLIRIDTQLSGNAVLQLNTLAGGLSNGSTADLATDWTGEVRYTRQAPDLVDDVQITRYRVGGVPAVEDVHLTLVPDPAGTGSVIQVIQPLSVEVNALTGVATVSNESGFDASLSSYSFSSDSGSLDPAGWNSLQDPGDNTGQDLVEFPRGTGSGDGWEEDPSSTASLLGEAYALGSTLADGGSLELGSLFDQTNGSPDLVFSYFDPVRNQTLVVQPTYVTVPGDYNLDGAVDAADYTVWRDSFGLTGSLPNSDPLASTPDVVDIEDYLFWRAQFGQGQQANAPELVGAPEPATASLFAISAIVTLLSRRRASSLAPEGVERSPRSGVRSNR